MLQLYEHTMFIFYLHGSRCTMFHMFTQDFFLHVFNILDNISIVFNYNFFFLQPNQGLHHQNTLSVFSSQSFLHLSTICYSLFDVKNIIVKSPSKLFLHHSSLSFHTLLYLHHTSWKSNELINIAFKDSWFLVIIIFYNLSTSPTMIFFIPMMKPTNKE